MNSHNFEPGNILKAYDNSRGKGFHPIIYIEGKSENDFIGAMITSSSGYGNIKMEESHFESDHEIVYSNSHLVPRRFIKPSSWGPFTKTGQLTAEGLEFVITQIKKTSEITFDEYIQQKIRSTPQ